MAGKPQKPKYHNTKIPEHHKTFLMGDFRKLKVWKKSKDLAVRIYKLTNQGHFTKDFRFRDQIRAAAISIPSNIAEGDELKTNNQSIQFFFIAKGSAAEIITQLIIAFEIDYITIEDYFFIPK